MSDPFLKLYKDKMTEKQEGRGVGWGFNNIQSYLE